MTVDELIRGKEFNIDDLVKTVYISYMDKVKICKNVFEKAMFVNKKYRANTPLLNLIYQMRLIREYLDIDIDDDVTDFDKLEANGFVESLQSLIPEEELRRFDEILGWIIEDYRGGKS